MGKIREPQPVKLFIATLYEEKKGIRKYLTPA